LIAQALENTSKSFRGDGALPAVTPSKSHALEIAEEIGRKFFRAVSATIAINRSIFSSSTSRER
jgi:hypothetical protein